MDLAAVAKIKRECFSPPQHIQCLLLCISVKPDVWLLPLGRDPDWPGSSHRFLRGLTRQRPHQTWSVRRKSEHTCCHSSAHSPGLNIRASAFLDWCEPCRCLPVSFMSCWREPTSTTAARPQCLKPWSRSSDIWQHVSVVIQSHTSSLEASR